MRESSIVVPQSYFIKKSDWCLKATNNNQPAAELIAVFIYHYDNRSANRILLEVLQRAINSYGTLLPEIEDWMPYSYKYLRELLLMTHGNNQVFKAIDVLEEIGFISLDVPVEVKDFYSNNHTWIKLEVEKIQKWIDDVWMQSEDRTIYQPKLTEMKNVIEKITKVEKQKKKAIPFPNNMNPLDAVQKQEIPDDGFGFDDMPKDIDLDDVRPKFIGLKAQIDAICAFDKHIHGRNEQFLYDKERRKIIESQLIQNRSMEECFQAIIGIIFDDYNNARHPQNLLGIVNPATGVKGKKYLDIAHIFKTAKRFEKNVELAEENKVTAEKAASEFYNMLKNIPSDYSLAMRKDKELKNEKRQVEDLQQRQKCKAFAGSIARFFLSNTSVEDLLELCEMNSSLIQLGADIHNPELLETALIEHAETFKKPLPEAVKTEIGKFAKEFCELQGVEL